ncbi:hypothetical protein GCM10008018_54000 [Paenibacillus marchantiophytorum]|uniref:Uncharacterized protein n=1 Tax=Paenibacillus marchantiophytorum TaxID=1619310 RepID=A0ABQ1F6B1_9BACL|nr:hypothetical protein [Paenibacillus marchantiophytorum]GGA00945.1 hypothetical protein GCM10008018_54000 [Paenibacillus marchantiophytorum]
MLISRESLTPSIRLHRTSQMRRLQAGISLLPIKNTNSMKLKQVAETFINAIDDSGLKTSMLANLNENKLVSDTEELLFDLNLNTYFINTP